LRTVDVGLNLFNWNLPAVTVGAITILTILVLKSTRLGSLGLVVAVVLGSLTAVLLDVWVREPVVLLRDLVAVPSALPLPVLPRLDDVLFVALPAVSLAFVALVQGAAVSAAVPAADGKPANASRDLIGQGAGNILSGLFRGMPVGGSMSGSSLVAKAGARTRLVYIIAGMVMAAIILLASDLVAFIAMPALAGLLIYVGITSVAPGRIYSVVKTGPLPTAVMFVTFFLTLIIPLQFAVLVGVGLGLILFVAQQSNRVRVRQVHISDDGRMRESDPPPRIAADEVVILQPYGSLFFGSAPKVERQLPAVGRESANAVVIVRLRGTEQIGLALVEVLRRYAHDLADAGSTLKVVVSADAVVRQMEAGGLLREIGESNLYRGTEWVGDALRHAHGDALTEIDQRQ
jgi:SulP family sulfate permease